MTHVQTLQEGGTASEHRTAENNAHRADCLLPQSAPGDEGRATRLWAGAMEKMLGIRRQGRTRGREGKGDSHRDDMTVVCVSLPSAARWRGWGLLCSSWRRSQLRTGLTSSPPKAALGSRLGCRRPRRASAADQRGISLSLHFPLPEQLSHTWAPGTMLHGLPGPFSRRDLAKKKKKCKCDLCTPFLLKTLL